MILSINDKDKISKLYNKELTKEDFLQYFNIKHAQQLYLELLKEALVEQDDEKVNAGLTVAFEFTLEKSDYEVVKNIFFQDWHDAHESIIFDMSKIKDCNLIDFFYKAIFFIPEYLELDENRALARKAFFALGNNIQCPKAFQYLQDFLNSTDPLLRSFAEEQMERLNN